MCLQFPQFWLSGYLGVFLVYLQFWLFVYLVVILVCLQFLQFWLFGYLVVILVYLQFAHWWLSKQETDGHNDTLLTSATNANDFCILILHV